MIKFPELYESLSADEEIFKSLEASTVKVAPDLISTLGNDNPVVESEADPEAIRTGSTEAPVGTEVLIFELDGSQLLQLVPSYIYWSGGIPTPIRVVSIFPTNTSTRLI